MTEFVDGSVRVRVPATCANLGPGFDALGLALGLHDEVRARVTTGESTVAIEGEGAESVARDESHLVLRAMRRTFGVLGDLPEGVALECRNQIPHGRGLGSSAAAIVAGILLARGLAVDGPQRLPDGEMLALAAEFEGHPDNVAPCLLGGLTIAWIHGTAHAVRRDIDLSVVPVVLIPPFAASTEMARGLLPEQVPHPDAAQNAGRAALLVAALTGTPQALFDATEDLLHQAYRAPAMPESAELVQALRAERLPAVISGAGPTVLVLARGETEAEAAIAHTPEGWTGRTLPVDPAGAHLLR
ncbi:MAG TPA: homoserine kinase [Jatrophihabitans sp.]|nr:homoserine kinase [Jatrophihabitans sp.]